MIFDGVFSQVDCIFRHFEYTYMIPPMIFWEDSKTFLAQLGPILEGGGASDAHAPIKSDLIELEKF